ncbi:MAG: DUF3365 domain-containing protein [Woeseiaceae bacterium]|nr:DUF3365 domain-containing protein [Woeseiaceae bacterium]
MSKTKPCTALLLVLAVAACSGKPQGTPTGAELLQPFKAQLKEALQAGVAEGPVSAIDVCAVKAPQIAASLSTNGVRMGRTSHKLRNPANVAPAWAREILETYLEEPEQRKPVTVALGNSLMGHVEPIVAQPMCLVCHGGTIAPDIAQAIDTAYPDDRAKGFEAGDLRGIFWVEYPEIR